MNIIVSGCGKIGQSIIQALAEEGHDVTALDNSTAVIDEVNNLYDIMCIEGNCTDCEVLTEARVSEAELFVCVTGSDELNMLSCYLAKKMGAKHTVARIRNPEYNYSGLAFLRQHLDISMTINPEMLVAKELYNILKFPSAIKIETFSRRDFEMLEVVLKPDSKLDGLSLIEMSAKYSANVLVCAVQRGEEVFIPNGSFVLKSGDKLGITATPTEIAKFFKELNVYQKEAKDVMILGGSRTAYYLTKMLINAGSDVKIIDKEQENCQRFCEDIPKANVVLGDGAQQELLFEEGIRDTEAFVALTGMDEQNILMAVFASSLNVPKSIAKINKSEMADLAEKLGLDTVVSPKKLVADVVVRYTRALGNSLGSNVETMYHTMDGKAEIVEFKVIGEFKEQHIPLKDLSLKENVLIAGILRQRKPIIPKGNDVILPNDRVIIIASGKRIQNLSDIFK